MEKLRIRIEVGDRKFEAEGPAALVEKQVNAFMKLTVGGSAETIAAEAAEAAKAPPPSVLHKIMRCSGTVVWLTVQSRSVRQALLVLMLGQWQLRSNALVSGADLIRGLRASGHRMRRADYLLNSLERGKYITIKGRHRRRRYQLTEGGARSAQEFAQLLLSAVPAPPPPPADSTPVKTA